MSPVYAEMSQTYPQLMFLTVDVNELMVTHASLNLSPLLYVSVFILCGHPSILVAEEAIYSSRLICF